MVVIVKAQIYVIGVWVDGVEPLDTNTGDIGIVKYGDSRETREKEHKGHDELSKVGVENELLEANGNSFSTNRTCRETYSLLVDRYKH